jgi:L-rhamnose mutarotase
MKLIGKLAVVAIAALVFVTACTKREDGWPNTGVINTIPQFGITNYRVNNAENKQLFDGWQFQFASNLRMQASKNGQVLQGEWRKFGDTLKIYSFAEYPLTLLNGSWGANIVNEQMVYTSRQDGAGVTELNFDVVK